MIVNDLDIVRVSVFPAEADPPLIVDPNAMLSGAIVSQLLEAIAGWDPKVVQLLSRIDGNQLAEHRALKLRRKPTDLFSSEKPLGVAIAEAVDHAE